MAGHSRGKQEEYPMFEMSVRLHSEFQPHLASRVTGGGCSLVESLPGICKTQDQSPDRGGGGGEGRNAVLVSVIP